MEKWICKQCGYAHLGDDAPEHCPQCNAPKAQFYRQDKNGGCSMSFLVIIILAGLLIGIGLASCQVKSEVQHRGYNTDNLIWVQHGNSNEI